MLTLTFPTTLPFVIAPGTPCESEDSRPLNSLNDRKESFARANFHNHRPQNRRQGASANRNTSHGGEILVGLPSARLEVVCNDLFSWICLWVPDFEPALKSSFIHSRNRTSAKKRPWTNFRCYAIGHAFNATLRSKLQHDNQSKPDALDLKRSPPFRGNLHSIRSPEKSIRTYGLSSVRH